MSSLEKSPYVTIHGPDGAGKTTVGRRLVYTLNEHGQPAIFFDDWRTDNKYRNPFDDAKLKERIDGTSKAFEALQAAKVAMDSIVITSLTDSGITVVKDRGILDVRADLEYRGLNAADCAGPLIREPDLTVLLTLSEETRRRHLERKVDAQPADYQRNIPGERMYAMDQSLHKQVNARVPGSGLIINTDPLSLEQVVNTIYDLILQRQ